MKEEEAGEETEGLTLIDAINGFSKISCLIMLCTVRHCCTLSERFALHCYRHVAILIICRPAELCHIITIR